MKDLIEALNRAHELDEAEGEQSLAKATSESMELARKLRKHIKETCNAKPAYPARTTKQGVVLKYFVDNPVSSAIGSSSTENKILDAAKKFAELNNFELDYYVNQDSWNFDVLHLVVLS